MTSSPPPRRFLPEPVETTTRSSRRPNRGNPEAQLDDRISDQNSSSPDTPDSLPHNRLKTASITRRFLPQPIEISSTSSRVSNEMINTDIPRQDGPEKNSIPHGLAETSAESKSQPRRFTPQPVETSTRNSRTKKEDTSEEQPQSTRKFYPEPIETTTDSNRKKQAEASEEVEAPRTRRKFSPEPIETTTKSNRKKEAENQDNSNPRPMGRKFAPEPIETTVRRRRKQTEEESDIPSPDEKAASRSSSEASSPRKFAPELIETARGSFRRGEASPRLPSSQTTDRPTAVPRSLPPPLAPSNSPSQSFKEVSQIHESPFSAASLAKRQSRQQSRQHSFVVPELPCIESDSSEANSAVPSLSTSPSAASEESINRLRKEEIRAGQDGSLQGYMLSLAAKTAEKQLMDQAMAAYPNEQVHEPVHHFAVEDSDEEPMSGRLEGANGIDARVFRRESGADLDWQMEEMRKHHAQLEDAKKALKEDTAGQSRFSAAALSARHKTQAKKTVGGHQKGVGLTEMRNAASPPMLGGDLVFPQSISPKMTRCDIDQIPVPRTYEQEGDDENLGDHELWCANVGVQNNAGAGLWMGLCQKRDSDEQYPTTPLRSGLMTPSPEAYNRSRAQGLHYGRDLDRPDQNLIHLSPTPANAQKDPFTESIDKKLNEELSIEETIEKEFHNGFITQIYNYLSLGYPSLAHRFDEELSKISRIAVEELRKDDDLADAKGYVGAPEGKGLDEESVREGKCARWTALRLYIHEWARQQPGMADRTPNEWGVRARRGSWAF